MDQTIQSHEALLIRAALASPFLKQLLVASAIAEAFREKGWDPLVIGDTAIAIHTQGRYVGTQLTMVLGEHPDVTEIMERLGFKRRTKGWVHPELDLTVPDMPTEVDPQSQVLEVLIEETSVPVISAEDALIDRLMMLRDAQDVKHGLTALLIALTNPDLDVEHLMLQAYRAGIFEGLLGLRELVSCYEKGEAPKRAQLEERLRDLF